MQKCTKPIKNTCTQRQVFFSVAWLLGLDQLFTVNGFIIHFCLAWNMQRDCHLWKLKTQGRTNNFVRTLLLKRPWLRFFRNLFFQCVWAASLWWIRAYSAHTWFACETYSIGDFSMEICYHVYLYANLHLKKNPHFPNGIPQFISSPKWHSNMLSFRS